MKKNFKLVLFIIVDLLSLILAWALAFVIIDLTTNNVLSNFKDTWYLFLICLALMYGLFIVFGLYSNIWRYAGMSEAMKSLEALIIFTACTFIISAFSEKLGYLWAFVSSFVFIICVVVSRFFCGYLARVITKNKARYMPYKRVIIIGAGDAGALLINEMKTSDKINMDPVCVLDDDPNKMGQQINGVRVVGQTSDVVTFAKVYQADEIIIAMPSVSEKIKSEIIAKCQETSCKIKILPGVYQFAEGKLSVSSIKEVSVTDLLGREPVSVNLDEIMGYIEDKIVLVTGGGGSIGSELCRQIATHNPRQLIILDIYENNAYDIQQELVRHVPNLNLEVLIASVRDSKKMDNVFEKYKPHIVFHAAAHKHVPLMEHCPNEAVKNNVSGTYKVADAAGRNGVEKFILISTDKAVNPTNIMGATKRICEMIVQTMNKVYKDTEYVAVRFGNVLGSNGSVIPLFRKQIAEGGPITVTHKDIVRYFMTIPEAVSLVLQAGAYAKGGEIFVLDMGNQVRIYDLAVNMIRLSGLEPFKDIDIKITGLRRAKNCTKKNLWTKKE